MDGHIWQLTRHLVSVLSASATSVSLPISTSYRLFRGMLRARPKSRLALTASSTSRKCQKLGEIRLLIRRELRAEVLESSIKRGKEKILLLRQDFYLPSSSPVEQDCCCLPFLDLGTLHSGSIFGFLCQWFSSPRHNEASPFGEERRLYAVQTTEYFRRTDIELVDTKAEQENRRAALREKTAHLETARKNVGHAIAEGSRAKTLRPMDFQVAADNLI